MDNGLVKIVDKFTLFVTIHIEHSKLNETTICTKVNEQNVSTECTIQSRKRTHGHSYFGWNFKAEIHFSNAQVDDSKYFFSCQRIRCTDEYRNEVQNVIIPRNSGKCCER